jgi:hypothetical protein
MSSFHRSNLYASEDDEEFDPLRPDEMDMSGFLGSPPPIQPQERARAPRGAPPISSRPRQTPPQSSNASGVNQPNMGYTLPITSEPTEPKYWHPIIPFYADDNSIGSPKITAIVKSVGATSIVLLGMYKLGKRGVPTPYANTAMYLSGAAYLHPTLGVNHGLLKGIPGQDNWIAKYPRYGTIGAVHLGGAYFFGSRIRRTLR